MKISPKDKMTKARANLVMLEPFFGTLALRLKLKEDPECKTAWVDGVTMGYNPKWVDGLPLTKVVGLFAHETMHPALLHHTRRGSRNARKWNVAADYVINNTLVKVGFDLPETECIDKKYEGMSTDHVYNLLPDMPENPDGQNGEDPGGCGAVRDAPSGNGKSPPTESETRAQEAEWKMALAQAAHVAKQAGKLPADMERLVEELLEPQLPWKQILRRFMTEKAKDDFSWLRPDRRFVSNGLYLPSRQSEGSGEMVVVIDTSGSIGQKELIEFGSELAGIIADVKPTKTYVIYCDAAVQKVDEFSPDETLTLEMMGGGGTDFRPPFDYLDGRSLDPKAVVYLTDGYGAFPDDEFRVPTMWVINNEQVIPPWGEHLILQV